MEGEKGVVEDEIGKMEEEIDNIKGLDKLKIRYMASLGIASTWRSNYANDDTLRCANAAACQ